MNFDDYTDDSRKRRTKEGAGQVGEILWNTGCLVLFLLILAGLVLGVMEF